MTPTQTSLYAAEAVYAQAWQNLRVLKAKEHDGGPTCRTCAETAVAEAFSSAAWDAFNAAHLADCATSPEYVAADLAFEVATEVQDAALAAARASLYEAKAAGTVSTELELMAASPAFCIAVATFHIADEVTRTKQCLAWDAGYAVDQAYVAALRIAGLPGGVHTWDGRNEAYRAALARAEAEAPATPAKAEARAVRAVS